MMNWLGTKLSFQILYLGVLILPLMAQEENQKSEQISDIIINGNKITQEYIIRREIFHPVNALYDSVLAAEDRNRIDNLGIFSEVKVMLQPNGDGTQSLAFEVVESWRIFPLPIIIYQEETGWSYGGMVVIKNFRGRNENLSAFASFGDRMLGGIGFDDPWILGDHVSFRGHIFFQVSEHLFLPHEYQELDFETTVGRYFGYQWKIWGTVSVEKRWIDYFADDKQDIEQHYFQTKFQLIYDTRDLYIDPSRGIYVDTQLRPEIGLDEDSPNFIEMDITASSFRLLIPGKRKWVVGASVTLHRYFGNSLPYKIFSVGGVESVRGWEVLDSTRYMSESFRSGLNYYYMSAELRQTLIPKRLTRFGTEFGLILAEFFDLGAADNTFSGMIKKEPIFGAGAGIRFYVPGNILFRLDYAVGYYQQSWSKPQWHISVGHKF
ncbi:MAG: BamA/TamA family outer membrane protein [Fidelibacterota bacterium]